MTIDDLVNIIRDHGCRDKWGYYIGGCEVLEYIMDVEGFIELLRGFRFRGMGVSFLDNHPEPVGVILGGGATFDYHKFGNRMRVTIGYDGDRSYWYDDCDVF